MSASCRLHDEQQGIRPITSGRKLPPVVPSVESAGCSTLSMRVMRATPAALMSCGTAPKQLLQQHVSQLAPAAITRAAPVICKKVYDGSQCVSDSSMTVGGCLCTIGLGGKRAGATICHACAMLDERLRTLSSGSSHMTKRAACGARAPKTYRRLDGGRYGLSSSSALAAALQEQCAERCCYADRTFSSG